MPQQEQFPTKVAIKTNQFIREGDHKAYVYRTYHFSYEKPKGKLTGRRTAVYFYTGEDGWKKYKTLSLKAAQKAIC